MPLLHVFYHAKSPPIIFFLSSHLHFYCRFSLISIDYTQKRVFLWNEHAHCSVKSSRLTPKILCSCNSFWLVTLLQAVMHDTKPKQTRGSHPVRWRTYKAHSSARCSVTNGLILPTRPDVCIRSAVLRVLTKKDSVHVLFKLEADTDIHLYTLSYLIHNHFRT